MSLVFLVSVSHYLITIGCRSVQGLKDLQKESSVHLSSLRLSSQQGYENEVRICHRQREALAPLLCLAFFHWNHWKSHLAPCERAKQSGGWIVHLRPHSISPSRRTSSPRGRHSSPRWLHMILRHTVLAPPSLPCTLGKDQATLTTRLEKKIYRRSLLCLPSSHSSSQLRR